MKLSNRILIPVAPVPLLVLVLLLVALLSSVSVAGDGNFRIRLREHYEYGLIDFAALNAKGHYSGFTNTANIWYEKPFHYSVGLAFSPVLGSFGNKNSAPPLGTDAKIRLWNLGVEGKYFPIQQNGFFTRAGIFGSLLDTRSEVGKISGASFLATVGYEVAVKKVGLALEAGVRQYVFESGTKATFGSIALGVHFYLGKSLD